MTCPPAESAFVVALTAAGVPVVCAAGPLDRPAVDELDRVMRTYRRYAGDDSAIICDLSRSEIVDPALVLRLLGDVATYASGPLLVLPCHGLPSRRGTRSSRVRAMDSVVVLDDVDQGLRMTAGPALGSGERGLRRVLSHALRDLRSGPPDGALDVALYQSSLWRLADAARVVPCGGPREIRAGAWVRRALICLRVRNYRDTCVALLTAEDHLEGRSEVPPPSRPGPSGPGSDLREVHVPRPRRSVAPPRNSEVASRTGRGAYSDAPVRPRALLPAGAD